MVTEEKKAAKAQISSVFLEKKNGNPVDIQHLSSTRQVPGSVTGAGHSMVNETDKNLCPVELSFSQGKQAIEETNKLVGDEVRIVTVSPGQPKPTI